MPAGRTKVALFWTKHYEEMTSVNNLVVGLDEARFEVMFIHLCGPVPEESQLRQAGYQAIYLSRKARLPFFSWLTTFRLYRTLKRHDVDILHCHGHKCTAYGALAAFFAKTPVVLAHVHGLGRARNIRRRVANLAIFRLVTRIICVAESVRADVGNSNWWVNRDKLRVLENSVDYAHFAAVSISKASARALLGLSPQHLVFGAIGRLAPTKGLPFLLDAFETVKAQLPEAELVLLGSGRSESCLRQHAATLHCKDAVHFLGQRSHIEKLLKALDVFVMPSVAEGMPRALMEAMAAGVPVISTRVGGIPDVINSPNVGFLVPPQDAPALAQTMIQAARLSEPQRATLCAEAQAKIRQGYSHDVVREKLRRIYEEEYANRCSRGTARTGRA